MGRLDSVRRDAQAIINGHEKAETLERLSREADEKATAKSELWIATFDKLEAIAETQQRRALKIGDLSLRGFRGDSSARESIPTHAYLQLLTWQDGLARGPKVRAQYFVAVPDGVKFDLASPVEALPIGDNGESISVHTIYERMEEYHRHVIRNPHQKMSERIYSSGTGDKYYDTGYSLEKGHFNPADSPQLTGWREWSRDPNEFMRTISPDLWQMTELVDTVDKALISSD